MHKSFSIFFSFIILVVTSPNTLLIADYQVNKEFYEAHCVNKDRPEMECHGKCQAKKEADKDSSLVNVVKIGSFEFNLIPNKNIEIPEAKIQFSEKGKSFFAHSTENILKGFHKILPHPPQV